MKKRFITVLLGVLLMPTVSFAGIPTLDVIGTPQAFMETVQTVFSKIENSQQVVTIQKTMAKIGSAKSTISDFINKTKDVATKYKTKMEEYINKGKEYLGKAQAFKAEAEKYIGMAKDISENGLGNTLKEKGGGILGGVAGELGLDGSKVENLANQAISGDFKSMAGDALGGVAGELGLDGSKVENLANQAISGDFKSVAGDTLGGVAGELGIDTAKVEGVVGEISTTTQNAKTNNKLVDAPAVATTRKAGGFTTLETKDADKKTAASQAKTEMAAAKDESMKQDIVKATADKTKLQVVDKTAVSQAKTETQALEKAVADKVQLQVGDKKSEIKAKAESLVKATAEKKQIKVDATAKAKVETQALTKVSADKLKVRPIENKSVAKTKIDATDLTKAVNNKALEKTKLEVAPINKEVNIKELKKISEPEKMKATPKRVQFKSSFGYGHLQKNYKLSFASLGGGAKTGDTPEGMMVIPESVAMYCELDYESAVEKGKLDECLRKLNTISTSMVTEERAKKEIDDATKDINNGYVEYLTATYFEALEAYNDSLTFKGNELDPVMTTKTSDIDASWRIAKEMHLVLGERVNKLRKLWARVLGMKMYSKYASEKFVSKE